MPPPITDPLDSPLSADALEERAAALVPLVREAGACIRTFYAAHAPARDKGGSPVTDADVEANRILQRGIENLFPGEALCTEEDRLDTGPAHRAWWIDPLDGTRGFVDRDGEFVVQVGLTVDGIPVLGLLYGPIDDLLAVGIHGRGAWLEQSGQRFTPTLRSGIHTADWQVVASRTARSTWPDRIARQLGSQRAVLRRTSVGRKVMCLLRGEADVYPHSGGLSGWDVCAPAAVAMAAGLWCRDARGQPIRLAPDGPVGTPGFIAATAAIAPAIEALVGAASAVR